MKKSNGEWDIKLWADCPYCENTQNIFSEYSEQECYSSFGCGEYKLLDTREGNEELVVKCDKCKKEYCISKVEH